MATALPGPRSVPTMYFIGVTTTQSSIMRVFPRWAEALGIEAELVGVDFALHDEPHRYHAMVEHIKHDPLSLGALVTTHKLDLLEAARPLFDELGPYASKLGEISCIAKRDTRLIGRAMDPITSGMALDAFVPPWHWNSDAEMLLLGAGGSSLALSVNLVERAQRGELHPKRIVVTNRSARRLEEMQAIHRQMPCPLPIEYVLAPTPTENDAVCAGLAPGSVIANATGLGKDRPGSPVTDNVRFPAGACVWDFNYRGDLDFLQQARAQQSARNLVIEDGWIYFIHGWTRVISEVFQVEIASTGPELEKLAHIAAAVRTAPGGTSHVH